MKSLEEVQVNDAICNHELQCLCGQCLLTYTRVCAYVYANANLGANVQACIHGAACLRLPAFSEVIL